MHVKRHARARRLTTKGYVVVGSGAVVIAKLKDQTKIPTCFANTVVPLVSREVSFARRLTYQLRENRSYKLICRFASESRACIVRPSAQLDKKQSGGAGGSNYEKSPSRSVGRFTKRSNFGVLERFARAGSATTV